MKASRLRLDGTMITTLFHKLRGKRRKHPIKRDETGKSARRRAFEAFDQGLRPARIAQLVPISPRTAYRYFADWKRLPKNLETRYRVAKAMLKNDTGFSQGVIAVLAEALGMSAEEVVERLQKPWGLKQLIMGRWPNRAKEMRQSEEEARLDAALTLIFFVEHSEMPPQEIVDWLLLLKEKFQKEKGGK